MLSKRRFLLQAGLAAPALFGSYALGAEPMFRLVVTDYQPAPPNGP